MEKLTSYFYILNFTKGGTEISNIQSESDFYIFLACCQRFGYEYFRGLRTEVSKKSNRKSEKILVSRVESAINYI